MNSSSGLVAICFILTAIQLDNDNLAYIGLGFGFFCWLWNLLLGWAVSSDQEKRPWRYW